MEVVPVVDEGLGNSAYVVGLGDGGALVVDPARDPGPYLAVAERHGWRIRVAAETHLHADFVSGARELATVTGAQVVASGGAPLGFPVRLVADGEELALGGLTLRVLATPGHTPEHVAYLIEDAGAPVAVFTGGTLIVGGVARSDLLGPDRTEALARAAWRSVRERLLPLPDDLPVYPTHGAGSFCSTGSGGQRTTTIGAERAGNPLFQVADEQAFVTKLLDGLGSYPPYFLELRDVNQAGPVVYGPAPPPLAPLDVVEAERLVADGAELVDVRDIEAFAAGHVPGSLSIAWRPQFATWLGWLVDRDRPLVLVADETTDRRALVWACLGIGYERLAGELAGGVAAWSAAGRPLARIPLRAPGEVGNRATLLDVRQHAERAGGHVPGSVSVELGALPARVGALGVGPPNGGSLAGQPLVAHCGHGERAMTAASLLARAGHRDVAAVFGGPEELAAALDRALEPTA